MNIKYGLKNSLKNLGVNKSRSVLTILGIVIGITSIILVMSLGKGASNLILNEIQGFGSKMMVIMPGRQSNSFDPSAMLDTVMNDSLKEKELEALMKKSNVPHLSRIMPIVFTTLVGSYENNTHRFMLLGATDLAAEIYDIYPEQGMFFNEEDVQSKASVVILGNKIKEELFGSDDAINQIIKLKGKNFKVIGILPKKGSGSMVNFDDSAFAPYTVVQEDLLGIKYFNRIVVDVDAEENVDRTVSDIEITIRNLHNITDPEKDDFYVETQADMIESVSMVTGVLTLFLASVAAISLLVGGVGIMNIMLVSVTERTREIGLRKAVGATGKDILTQFLLEAVLLTSIGGFIGIFLGTSFGFLISLAITKFAGLNWGFVFSVDAALLGLGVAALVGLIFGIYPARQASKKSPIEALRYE
jgi:putative ABC transport system permease protein